MTYELGLERGRRKTMEPVGAQALVLEEAAGAVRGASPLQSRHCRRPPTDGGWTLPSQDRLLVKDLNTWGVF